MNSYRYRITVDALTDAKGEPVQGRTLIFEAMNHDDILTIVDRMRARLPFDGVTVASLAVGLKLFSEVALTHREDPIFAKIRPALSEFIGELKQRLAELASIEQN
ncbi:DUF3861 domain-containing protein [Granulicella arctica]|uniref:DUF3861 domain-containing protein n=1 Tax=Granulicella arctica TaxID=940613 RepID=A0A7Y9TT51_9BACT|nr:DUF3861 domain-containing protein [Granulicella arctica]NYF79648.1 hypothetical protein [Granulicella arctica]